MVYINLTVAMIWSGIKVTVLKNMKSDKFFQILWGDIKSGILKLSNGLPQ